MPGAHSTSSLRSRAAAAAIATGGATAYAGYRASIDLDPVSLWHDDVWMVALATAGDANAWLASPSSASVSFKAIVRLSDWMGADPELAVQAFPFACGLLAVALTGWLAFRLTGSALVTAAAAMWLACDVVFLRQMARVKTYTLDAALGVAQALCLCALIDGYSRRRLWIFTATVVLGLALSSASLFTGFAFTAVMGLALWRRGVRDPHLLWANAVVLAAAGAVVALAIGAPGHGDLQSMWEGHYLPVDNPVRAAAAAGRWGWLFVGRLVHSVGLHVGPLPAAVPVGFLLATLGAVHLWCSSRRTELVAGGLVFVALFAASAARQFPLGAQRVEVFLVPFGALLLAASLGWVERIRSASIAMAACGIAFALLVVQLPSPRETGYPQEHGAPVVARMTEMLVPGDGVWSNMRGAYSLAVYGPWHASYGAAGRLGIPYPAFPDLDFALMDVDDDVVDRPPPPTPRIFVFVCNAGPDLWRQSLRVLREQGYQVRDSFRRPRCRLAKMERPPLRSSAD